jgi:hypothetical protein
LAMCCRLPYMPIADPSGDFSPAVGAPIAGQGDPSLWNAATEGGLVGVAKHFGFQEPQWSQDVGQFLRSPEVNLALGAVSPGGVGTVGKTISTRFPTAVKATEDALTDHNLTINGDIAARDPNLMAKNTNLMRSYSNLMDAEASGSPPDVTDAFKNRVKDNLLWLYDQVPPDIRERSMRWYDGANAIAKSRADMTNQPIESTAGVYAALSPQKDWF